VAAHLHDSVLQTLALVQRNAADPTAVRRLARRQERELRDWLYGQAAAPSGSLSAALAAAAAEVEDATGVVIDLVTVGDVPLDDRVAAMVAAAREALLNAARHAGVDKVSAFAEVEDGAVVVYIRDRGRGFRPADVPVDRHGLRESVSGRVERAGGRVEVRSALGEGTEIALRMPRSSS
jgi:signal transduction histidine kinase